MRVELSCWLRCVNTLLCDVVQAESVSDTGRAVQYELRLYKDADYKEQLTSFPTFIDNKRTLYVQASLTAGLLSSVTLKPNCVYCVFLPVLVLHIWRPVWSTGVVYGVERIDLLHFLDGYHTRLFLYSLCCIRLFKLVTITLHYKATKPGSVCPLF